MTVIKLYGDLGRVYTKEIKLQVNSVYEAIAALEANFPGFKKYISNKSFHIFIKGMGDISEEDLELKTGTRTIKIAPVLSGGKKAFKIIVGIALIVIGTITGQPWLVNIGYSLAISGVVDLLFTPPIPTTNNESVSGEASYNFTGPVNTVAQGYPVPIGYGRVLVGSAVISAGIQTQTV